MRFSTVAGCAVLILLLTALGCGGGGYSGNPAGGPSPPVTGAATISIVGQRGAQSFTPNPGTGGNDQTFVWRNNDSVTHRIVVNDTPLDTGDIAPGATSRSIQLPANGAN